MMVRTSPSGSFSFWTRVGLAGDVLGEDIARAVGMPQRLARERAIRSIGRLHIGAVGLHHYLAREMTGIVILADGLDAGIDGLLEQQ